MEEEWRLVWRYSACWTKPHCCQWTIISNSYGHAGEKECSRERLCLPRDYVSGHEQNVGENMDSGHHSDEVSDGNQERVTGNWRKGDFFRK